MPKKQTLDDLHYHEVADRCHLVNMFIQESLLNHPVLTYIGHKTLRDRVIKAQELIGEVYQLIGQLEHRQQKN